MNARITHSLYSKKLEVAAVRRRLLAVALLIVAACNPADPTSPLAARVRVVETPGPDTIEAFPSTPLTIEVEDADGQPLRDMPVTFQGVGVGLGTGPEITVAPVGIADPNLFAYRFNSTTDRRGRAAVQIRLGQRTPEGRLVVRVGDLPQPIYQDTIAFTILAGVATAVRMTPRDTAVYVDRTLQLQGHVVDRHGNWRGEPVTYEAGPSLTVTEAGLVTPSVYARSWVVARGAVGQDTGRVSVVPHGQVLGVGSTEGGGAFILFELDGSRLHVIPALVGTRDAAPAWAPDGEHFVYSTFSLPRNQGGELFVADTLGQSVRLFPPFTFRNAAYARYSNDGEWIYFSGQLWDEVFRLWRVHPDGSGAESLGTDLGGGRIDWRPDPAAGGGGLAFITRSEGNWVARTLDLTSREVSSWALTGIIARWSPTGDRLAVVPDGIGPILVANADGTSVRAVTPGDGWFGWFDWSPDGEWLVLNHANVVKLLHVGTGLLLPLAWSEAVAQPTWRR